MKDRNVLAAALASLVGDEKPAPARGAGAGFSSPTWASSSSSTSCCPRALRSAWIRSFPR